MPMVKMRVETALGPLAVQRHDDGVAAQPALLLWHSLFLDGHSWDGVLPALTPGRTVLVVDGPCHGESPGPDRRFSLDECADAALAVLDHAGCARADWVGNAWGGHVGVVLAARAPGRVRSLAVLCSPLQPLSVLDRVRATALGAVLRVAGWRGFLLGAVRSALLRPPWRPEVAAQVDAAVRGPGAARTLWAMRSVMLGRPSLLHRLAQVRCPTLLVAADGSKLWPPALAADQARGFADARCEIITGVGHIPPLEAPDATAALLTSWLSSREDAT